MHGVQTIFLLNKLESVIGEPINVSPSTASVSNETQLQKIYL